MSKISYYQIFKTLKNGKHNLKKRKRQSYPNIHKTLHKQRIRRLNRWQNLRRHRPSNRRKNLLSLQSRKRRRWKSHPSRPPSLRRLERPLEKNDRQQKTTTPPKTRRLNRAKRRRFSRFRIARQRKTFQFRESSRRASHSEMLQILRRLVRQNPRPDHPNRRALFLLHPRRASGSLWINYPLELPNVNVSLEMGTLHRCWFSFHHENLWEDPFIRLVHRQFGQTSRIPTRSLTSPQRIRRRWRLFSQTQERR